MVKVEVMRGTVIGGRRVKRGDMAECRESDVAMLLRTGKVRAWREVAKPAPSADGCSGTPKKRGRPKKKADE